MNSDSSQLRRSDVDICYYVQTRNLADNLSVWCLLKFSANVTFSPFSPIVSTGTVCHKGIEAAIYVSNIITGSFLWRPFKLPVYACSLLIVLLKKLSYPYCLYHRYVFSYTCWAQNYVCITGITVFYRDSIGCIYVNWNCNLDSRVRIPIMSSISRYDIDTWDHQSDLYYIHIYN